MQRRPAAQGTATPCRDIAEPTCSFEGKSIHQPKTAHKHPLREQSQLQSHSCAAPTRWAAKFDTWNNAVRATIEPSERFYTHFVRFCVFFRRLRNSSDRNSAIQRASLSPTALVSAAAQSQSPCEQWKERAECLRSPHSPFDYKDRWLPVWKWWVRSVDSMWCKQTINQNGDDRGDLFPIIRFEQHTIHRQAANVSKVHDSFREIDRVRNSLQFKHDSMAILSQWAESADRSASQTVCK